MFSPAATYLFFLSSYKQQKFNLFREECEGYAKLVTELNQDLSGAGASASEILGVVKSIIGYFNLDPNRVLDLILESFERHLDSHEFFAELIRLYTPDDDTLAELLAFKFKFYEGEEGGVPASLYRQAALLVQHGILGLEQTWAMLAPVDDASVREEAEKELKEAREFVRKMNVVSTNKEKGGGGGDEDGNGDGNAATSGDSTGYVRNFNYDCSISDMLISPKFRFVAELEPKVWIPGRPPECGRMEGGRDAPFKAAGLLCHVKTGHSEGSADPHTPDHRSPSSEVQSLSLTYSKSLCSQTHFFSALPTGAAAAPPCSSGASGTRPNSPTPRLPLR